MLRPPHPALLTLPLVLAACAVPDPSPPGAPNARPAAAWDNAPRATASEAFWRTWGDGNAELSAYRAVQPRYGAPREAEVVLIYVTEPHDRRTWIKDDDVRGDDHVNVLKLNVAETFQTGVYPYSVLTSVFAPVDAFGPERFTPAKITMSAQEWCGHVYHAVWPGRSGFRSALHSYFAQEGETDETVPADDGALYEDALLVQLRELDGPFAEGGAWAGPLVPSLWGRRTAHTPLRPVDARITRADTVRAGVPVTRFTLTTPTFTRTYDVERAAPRRVLAWADTDGNRAELVRTARLPYWQLNRPGDERLRVDAGRPSDVRLSVDPGPPLSPVPPADSAKAPAR